MLLNPPQALHIVNAAVELGTRACIDAPCEEKQGTHNSMIVIQFDGELEIPSWLLNMHKALPHGQLRPFAGISAEGHEVWSKSSSSSIIPG